VRRYSLSGSTMGTRWTAMLHASDPIDVPALADNLAAEVGLVDRQMSTWNAGSELMRLNAAKTGAWISIPPELAEVLAAALRIGRLSGGAFDIGVGSVVAWWGFGAQADAPGKLPQASSPGLSIDLLEVDEARGRARKHAPLALDLSGIAKGYGVDRLAMCCDRHGITSYLVGIDGELRAKGTKPDGEPYTVALERPDPDCRAVLGVVEISDCAIATSGDYRQRRKVGGAWVSHTMDPRSGQPVRDGPASVTVLAGTAMEADALATALLVMGIQEGPALARALNLDALFVARTPKGFVQTGVGRLA
jgi:FAD:protein FMN transferase